MDRSGWTGVLAGMSKQGRQSMLQAIFVKDAGMAADGIHDHIDRRNAGFQAENGIDFPHDEVFFLLIHHRRDRDNGNGCFRQPVEGAGGVDQIRFACCIGRVIKIGKAVGGWCEVNLRKQFA